jgi:hypothetical protein
MHSNKFCPGESCGQQLNEGEKLCPHCQSKKNKQTKIEAILFGVQGTIPALFMAVRHYKNKI